MKLRRRRPSPEQLLLPFADDSETIRQSENEPVGDSTESDGQIPVALPLPVPPPLAVVVVDPTTASISGLTPRFLEFSAAIDRSAYTLDALRLDLSLLIRFLGDRVASEVSLDDLRRFASWLAVERKNDPRSLRRKVASIKAFFAFLRDNGVRPDDPAEGLVYPALEPHVPEVLDAGEELRLLAAAERPLWRALLLVLLDTGLKRDEVLALHPADIYLDPALPSRGYLVVRATDQARRLRPRTLALTPRLADDLSPRIAPGDNQRIFDISVRAVNFIVESCADRADLRKRGTVSPQMLRDTYALREVRRRVATEHDRRLAGASPNALLALRHRHDAEVCDLLGLTPGETNDPIARYRFLCPDA